MTSQLALSTANWILLAGVIINGLAFVGVIVSLLLLRAQGLAVCELLTLVIAYQNMTAQMADMDRYSPRAPRSTPVLLRRLEEPPRAEDEHSRVFAGGRDVRQSHGQRVDAVSCPEPRGHRSRLGGLLPRCGTRRARRFVNLSSGLRNGSEWFSNSPLTTLFSP